MESATIVIGKLEQDMMTETTTIEITKSQRQRLRDVNSGSAKAAVDDLLNAYEGENEDMPAALSYEDVVAASEQGTRQALEDYQG